MGEETVGQPAIFFFVKIAFVSSGILCPFGGMRGKYEKCTHSLGSQKREKPIQECNKEALWDDDVRTFYANTARNKDKKQYVFFSFSAMGRRGEYSSESQQSPGATWGGDEPNERLTYQVDGKIGAYQANNG